MLRPALLALTCCVLSFIAASAPALDLSGNWRFATDPQDQGERAHWFDGELTGTTTIHLPGSMAEQGFGDDITTATQWTGDIHNPKWYEQPEFQQYISPKNFKFPFWLTPKKHYVGSAWYQRTIDIPETSAGQPLRLFLERAHWRTSVWLDSQQIGTRDSLSTPHQYNLPALTPGKHRLTICVDNRLQAAVGVNAHSVSDHTQTNWNGIIGRMEIDNRPEIAINALRIKPHLDGKAVRVELDFEAEPGTYVTAELQCQELGKKQDRKIGHTLEGVNFDTSSGTIECNIPITEPLSQWSEFHPALYRIVARVGDDHKWRKGPHTDCEYAFGFRDFRTSGTQFAVNGHPAFLRGTLECCIFPLTGYPPMEVEPWRRILRIARAHGLNHLRFHSWCPPEAAFQAADEMGFYYSIECASWATVGENPDYEKWLYEEAHRIVDTYGNHPSFCMMLYGNEPHGDKQKQFLAKWDKYWTAYDNRRLYSGGSGWPIIPENEFHITPTPRIARGVAMKARINSLPPETVTDYRAFIAKQKAPVISHEIGQWCVYPNLTERAKYTGVLRALNFDIFSDSLEQHHMLDQAHDFLIASGKLQAICYKEEIESALRTPGMAGFQLLDLHDFPGQGTALVGVLDPFWDEKGYISAEEYHRFACETIPLARFGKRAFTTDETLTASLEVTHYDRAPLHDALTTWTLRETGGRQIASGELRADIPLGSATKLTDVQIALGNCSAPAKLTFELNVAGENQYTNSWDLWVYPTADRNTTPSDVLITRRLDDAALQSLQGGGKVLLVPERAAIKPGARGPVAAGFSTIFWNTAWFPQQEPVTLGLLCDPKHPLFARFPTEFHTNWQWWYVLHRSQCMIMDGLPSTLRPLVQMIDDWPTNRRLGLVFEAQYGGGKLMVCSADLTGDLTGDPVSKQFRNSLLEYMASGQFSPKVPLTPDQLQSVISIQ